jgi:hypothetical protein
MSRRIVLTITAVACGLIASAAMAQHVIPSALLTIDQNRATVVERIVGEWGSRLSTSNAGISAAQLREILTGLRSDHLLAASLAGSIEGLRDVVSGALVRTDVAVSPKLIHTKSLGDTTDDLVYTPVVPCRIVDTRSGGGGVFLPGNQRDWLAFSPSGFASQGGSATNCGIPVRPAAIMANTTLANTVGGPEFFELWPFNQTRPTASTVNWFGPGQQPANAEIVPLCTGGGCTSDFSAFASGQTHAIVDVLGYFNRPTNYGGTHTITGALATDSGGFSNTANGDYSTVAGGYQNTASGPSSTVAGGNNNIASGFHSTVPGGVGNTASGDYSFAAGFGAVAIGNGSFVWADNLGFTFEPSRAGSPASGWANPAHTFNVRATGGVWFVTGLDVDFKPTTGPFVNPGSGTWAATSDRATKENFQRIEPREVLAKVRAMPIASWNYITEGAHIRHLGPVSQDFYAAFALGGDDKSITSIDEGGVALAAIQGLHQTVRQQMREKDKEIAQLRRKLLAIEAKLGM